MTTLDRCISCFLVGVCSVGLVLSLGGSIWTGFWLSMLITACLTTLTFGDRR